MQHLIMLLLPFLSPVLSAPIKGSGACPLSGLSVPEGSSGCIEIKISEKSPVLCKMQTTVAAMDPAACTYLMVLNNKDTLTYYNSTFEAWMALSAQFVTVKKAQKWMAVEYRVVSSLHETCLARINLSVLDAVLSPPPITEPATASEGMTNPTGEGNSHKTLSNGSPGRETRSRYGVWASLALWLLLLLYFMYTRTAGGEGAEIQHCGEEEGNLDPARVTQQEPNGEAAKELPLNGEATKP